MSSKQRGPEHKPSEGSKKAPRCERNLVHKAAAGRHRASTMQPRKGKGAYSRHDKTWRETPARAA